MRLPPSTLRSTIQAAACFAALVCIVWAGDEVLMRMGTEAGHSHDSQGDMHLLFVSLVVGFFPALIEPRRTLQGIPLLALGFAIYMFGKGMGLAWGGTLLLMLFVYLPLGALCFTGALVGVLVRTLYVRHRSPRLTENLE